MEFIRSVLSPGLRPGRLAELGLGAGSTSLSGGETREDGQVSFGFSLMRGKRPNMEDFHHAEVTVVTVLHGETYLIGYFFMQFRKDKSTGESVGFFGVFDGAF